jgi:hypothetical protein
MEGPVHFSADLTAKGKSADEVKRSLNSDLSADPAFFRLSSLETLFFTKEQDI